MNWAAALLNSQKFNNHVSNQISFSQNNRSHKYLNNNSKNKLNTVTTWYETVRLTCSCVCRQNEPDSDSWLTDVCLNYEILIKLTRKQQISQQQQQKRDWHCCEKMRNSTDNLLSDFWTERSKIHIAVMIKRIVLWICWKKMKKSEKKNSLCNQKYDILFRLAFLQALAKHFHWYLWKHF